MGDCPGWSCGLIAENAMLRHGHRSLQPLELRISITTTILHYRHIYIYIYTRMCVYIYIHIFIYGTLVAIDINEKFLRLALLPVFLS